MSFPKEKEWNVVVYFFVVLALLWMLGIGSDDSTNDLVPTTWIRTGYVQDIRIWNDLLVLGLFIHTPTTKYCLPS